MTNTIKLWVYDRPGALDTITGLIRRKGVNIRTLTAGDIADGISQITISIKDYVDVEKLGIYFSEMSFVKGWEKCTNETHIIRELLLLRFHKADWQGVNLEGVRVTKEDGDMVFAEYVAAPNQIDDILATLKQHKISFVRTGALGLALKEEGQM